MRITSAQFIKGIVDVKAGFPKNLPQVAFIGRSNVGKSSTINAITKQKGLARTSSFPGRTTEINLFLINENFYLVDLPGYGFAKASLEGRQKIQDLINDYLFESDYTQKKVVLIIDALVGPTAGDMDMLLALEQRGKDIVIAANKADKIKSSVYSKQIKKIQDTIGPHLVIPYSAETKKGLGQLIDVIVN
jgi:GTP-binding protein